MGSYPPNVGSAELFGDWLKGVRVLLVESDPHEVAKYSKWITSAGGISEPVSTPEQALRIQGDDALGYNVVVLSESSPEGNGIAAAREITRRLSVSRPLVLGATSYPALVRAVYGIPGAMYLSKQATMADFLFVLARMADIELPAFPSLLMRLSRRWKLSGQQAKILWFDLWGCSDREIADALGISLHTVQDYQIALRRKTGARSKTGYLRLLLESMGLPSPNELFLEGRPPRTF